MKARHPLYWVAAQGLRLLSLRCFLTATQFNFLIFTSSNGRRSELSLDEGPLDDVVKRQHDLWSRRPW